MRIKNLFTYLFIFIFFLACQQTNEDTAITKDKLKQHISFLASDDLKGRGTGTEGNKKAGDYIRNQFDEMGLRLLGENGLQYFDVLKELKINEENTFFKLKNKAFILNQDFNPISFSADGNLKSEIAFLSYGLSVNHDSISWNDYKDIDVKGKWVMILKDEPDVKYKNILSDFSDLRTKVLSAEDHGAKGVIFVSGVHTSKKDIIDKFTFSRNNVEAGILVVQVNRQLANKILANKNIEDLENKINVTQKTQSFTTSIIVDAKVKIIKEKVKTQNVVAILENSNKTTNNEFIVIGGHYDHLGMGGKNSGSRMPDTIAVHNGADDNASGIASILEIAEKLTSQKENLTRDIIFIAFSGEEMGLLGSNFFVKNSLVDLKNIKAMLNLDMIGRLDTTSKSLTVGGTGTTMEWDSIIDHHTKNYNFDIQKSKSGFAPSDNASFYAENIPVLFFSTGVHDDYHKPSDDIDKINFEGLEKVTSLVYDIALTISKEQKLSFNDTGEIQQNKMSREKLKVKLDILPDFSNIVENGLRIDGIIKGGIAERYGLQKKDIIIAMDGKKINNIYDYMSRLKSFKPDQLITIDVLRDNKKKVFIVNL